MNMYNVEDMEQIHMKIFEDNLETFQLIIHILSNEVEQKYL